MEIQLTLRNPEGLHARPAGLLVKTANQFKAKVEIAFNGKNVNAKSVFSLMSLGLVANSQFTLRAEGEDAETALASLRQLVENQFKV